MKMIAGANADIILRMIIIINTWREILLQDADGRWESFYCGFKVTEHAIKRAL